MMPIQKAKLDMYRAVLQHFDNYPAIVSSNAAFSASVTTFRAGVNSVAAKALQIEDSSSIGVTADKQITRAGLEDATLTVAGQVYAYATSVTNVILQSHVRYTKSDLSRASGEDLVTYCQETHDVAQANLPALLTFGVTAASLGTFQTQITGFSAKVSSPRGMIEHRRMLRAQLVVLFTQTDVALHGRLTKLIGVYKTTNPDFASEFFLRAELVDPPTSHTKISGMIVSAADGSPVMGATISIAGQDLTTTSDELGSYKFPIVKPGVYTVHVEAAGFVAADAVNRKIARGKSVVVDFRMVN